MRNDGILLWGWQCILHGRASESVNTRERKLKEEYDMIFRKRLVWTE